MKYLPRQKTLGEKLKITSLECWKNVFELTRLIGILLFEFHTECLFTVPDSFKRNSPWRRLSNCKKNFHALDVPWCALLREICILFLACFYLGYVKKIFESYSRVCVSCFRILFFWRYRQKYVISWKPSN